MKRASTLICWRSSDNSLLMVQRRSKSRAFAGAFVFPGGIEEESDATWPFVEKERVCAIRELFEETGIVLGKLQMSHLRKDCSENAAAFKHVYSEEEMKCAAARLKIWSVWLTPKEEKFRYYTTFYLVSISDSEASAALQDDLEVVSAKFDTPAFFLDKHRKNEIILVPPTFVTLMELQELGDRAFQSVRTGRIIEPTLVQRDGSLIVALPDDFEHYQYSGVEDKKAPMRRILIEPGKPFKWIDTINNTVTPTSAL